MKPFTLEWWLSVLVSQELNLDSVLDGGNGPTNEVRRLVKVCDYIRERIIDKYGEQSQES